MAQVQRVQRILVAVEDQVLVVVHLVVQGLLSYDINFKIKR